jgi:hypothetical protein
MRPATIRQIRTRIAAAIAGVLPASFVIHMWLFISYFDSHPREPNPELGLMRPLNNHGSYVFISDAESTGLALLIYAFIMAFGFMILVVPKEFQLPPPGTPRWLTRVSARFKTDLEKPSIELTIIFLGSLACFTVLIWLGGRSIVEFFVANGFVLHL